MQVGVVQLSLKQAGGAEEGAQEEAGQAEGRAGGQLAQVAAPGWRHSCPFPRPLPFPLPLSRLRLLPRNGAPWDEERF